MDNEQFNNVESMKNAAVASFPQSGFAQKQAGIMESGKFRPVVSLEDDAQVEKVEQAMLDACRAERDGSERYLEANVIDEDVYAEHRRENFKAKDVRPGLNMLPAEWSWHFGCKNNYVGIRWAQAKKAEGRNAEITVYGVTLRRLRDS